jgi:hypothetical protein
MQVSHAEWRAAAVRVTMVIVLCNPAQRPRSSFRVGFKVTAPDLLLPPAARLYRFVLRRACC